MEFRSFYFYFLNRRPLCGRRLFCFVNAEFLVASQGSIRRRSCHTVTPLRWSLPEHKLLLCPAPLSLHRLKVRASDKKINHRGEGKIEKIAEEK